MQRILHITLLLLILTIGCGRNDRIAERLDTIDTLCDTDPRLAVSMLDSIDSEGLSDKDRHRIDLLTVKSRDKAYILHTSDSLILDIIDYYSRHRKEGLYAEALYYGGRVYSDLGDLPTALEYFQKALDEIPDTESHMEFKRRVLSQTGRLLINIKLYRQALPYIQKSLGVSKKLKDSLNVVYDDILLTSVNINTDSLEQAKTYLSEAIAYSNSIPDVDKYWLQATQALILYKEGKIESALNIVRPLPAAVDSLCENYSLSVAADIYHAAGIVDTAYMYAQRLAISDNINNRINGFQTLFSKDLYSLIPEDSIKPFVYRFTLFIEDYLKRYEAEDAILRNARYNYDLHVQQQKKAERAKIWIATIASVIIVALIITILLYRVKNLYSEIKLRMALDVTHLIIYNLNPDNSPKTFNLYRSLAIDMSKPIKGLLPGRSRQQILKKELLERLHQIAGSTVDIPSIDKRLLDSNEMKYMRKAIDKGMAISHKLSIWKDIEAMVIQSSPDFKNTLMTLSYGRMTDNEYQVALLSRFGIKPMDMAILIGRSRQAVSDRRSSLSLKIFEQPRMTEALDKLILRL